MSKDKTRKIKSRTRLMVHHPTPERKSKHSARAHSSSEALFRSIWNILGTAAYMAPEQARGKAVDTGIIAICCKGAPAVLVG
jgi:hypothetical protein